MTSSRPMSPYLLLIASAWLASLLLFGPTAAQNQTSNDHIANTTNTYPNPEYAKLLGNSLWFYEAQRSGKLPANNRVNWRTDSALDDGSDVGVDLSGGYYDAGDYMKFGFPCAYAMTMLSWSGIEYFEGFVLANETQHLYDALKWGFDYLVKVHHSKDELYIQVGDTSVDHDYWGPDTGIPKPRPSLKIDRSNPGTDVAAETAAAFAAGSILFGDENLFAGGRGGTDGSDPGYSEVLLGHATDLFEFAETAKQQTYTTFATDARDSYLSVNFGDELAWGATWLYLATKNSTYLEKAVNYYDASKLNDDTHTNPLDWGDKTAGVNVLLSRAMLALNDARGSKYLQITTTFLDSIVSVRSPRLSRTDAGMLWWDGSSDAASTPVILTTVLLLYITSDKLLASPPPPFPSTFNSTTLGSSTSTPQKARYCYEAGKQMNILFGDNPLRAVYVCGIHPNSPRAPHHAGASGITGLDNIDKTEDGKYQLYGAVVAGPDKNDGFSDVRSDWMRTEVALDFNAPFVGVVARSVIAELSDPFYVSVPYTPRNRGGISLGIIAAIVISGIVLIGCLVVFWKRKNVHAWWGKRRGRK